MTQSHWQLLAAVDDLHGNASWALTSDCLESFQQENSKANIAIKKFYFIYNVVHEGLSQSVNVQLQKTNGS